MVRNPVQSIIIKQVKFFIGKNVIPALEVLGQINLDGHSQVTRKKITVKNADIAAPIKKYLEFFI